MIKNKKADMQWSVLVYFILGLVVIFIVVMGIVGPGVGFAKKKFFNEESGQWKWPWSPQGNFTPYNPDEHLSMNEIIVQDSVKALQCAINSQAVGKFDYTNTNVCPAGYTIPSQTKITASAILTGFAVNTNNEGIKYGFSKVSCSGISSRSLSFEGKNESQAIQLLGDAVEECYKNSKNVDLEYKYTKCAYYDPGESNAGIAKSVTQDKIKLYLKNKNTEDSINAASMLGRWTNRVKTDEVKLGSEGCVYYNKNYADTVDIKDCNVDNPTDYFDCYVSNFTLPQNITTAQEWIPAFGDPEYLVYYEKFPEAAATYWHKEWTDMFNLYTIGFVTASGILNTVGAGKVAKIAQVGKEGVEELGEKLIKEGVQEAAEQTSGYILKRAAKSNLKNILKSLVAEDQFARITLMSDDIAQEIGEVYLTRIGTRSGKEAFDKIEKELEEDIVKIIRSKITKTPAGFQWADKSLQEYQDEVIKVIMQGGKTTDGLTITGLREFTEKQLSKEITKELLEKQTYKTFFQTLFKKGTTELDQALLDEATEKSFARLAKLNDINPAYVERSLSAGAAKVGKILLQGTTGVTETDILEKKFFTIIGKQLPIKWDANHWYTQVAFGIPEWVKNHPLPSAVILSVLIDGIDSTNEKYVPVGVNSLAITKPSLLGGKNIFELNNLAEKYHIITKLNEERITEQMRSPLYLVSPCSANLKVVKRKCTCANNPTLSVFNFGGGLINTEQGTIELKDEEERRIGYTKEWNSLPESQKTGYSETLEKYINRSLNRDNEELIKIQKGNFGGTLDLGWMGGGKVEQMVKYNFNLDSYDFSNAVKICSDRTVIGGVFHSAKTFGYGWLDAYYQGTGWEPTDAEWDKLFNANIDYKSDCIEVEPERLSGYCYDHFPATEGARIGLTVINLAVDVAIMGGTITFTGGTLTWPSLAISGFAFASADFVLESFEKWP